MELQPEVMNNMQTGQIITALRTKANLTQEQLAEKLFVSRDLVSKWETGKRRPDYQTVQKLAELFSVDPDEIVPRDSLLMQELAGCFPADYSVSTETLTAKLNAFLETLGERDRCVFIRRYYFMEEPSAIGAAYGIRENYVRTLLMRARKRFRKYLKEV